MNITSKFKTVLTKCFSHQIGGDDRANGNVCLVQIRKNKAGFQKRLINVNGAYSATGKPESISEEAAINLAATAE